LSTVKVLQYYAEKTTMSMGAILAAGSGINAMSTWLDTTAGNIANSNDAVPGGKPTYRTQEPVLATIPATPGGVAQGRGVAVAGIALGSSTGSIAYEPGNPIANAQGMVSYPSVGLGGQMVDMLSSQIGYQANVDVVKSAYAAYQSLLSVP
jgi:flagellar basal-body rod protein FlgC